MYENKIHVVNRRYSDFEYLLKSLQDKSQYCFPILPEKRVLNNLDKSFVQQRKVELEGFLRVLVQMDNQVKTDMNLKVFLTFEDTKYKQYRQDPKSMLANLSKIYSYVPRKESIKMIKTQGVTKTVKQVITRAKHEIKGINEPEDLIEDSGGVDFDLIQKNVDSNLQMLSES